MDDFAQLRRKFRKKFNLDPDYAIVGDGNVPSNIRDPQIPGNILVRRVTSNGLSTALSVGAPANNIKLNVGDPVVLEMAYGKLRIKEVDNDADVSRGGDPVERIFESDYITQMMISTFRPRQTATASLTVNFSAWAPITNNRYRAEGGYSADYTAFIPTAGNMRVVTAFLKPDFTMELKASTSRGVNDVPPLGDSDVQENLSAKTPGSLPIWSIFLEDDPAEITQDIIDSGVDHRQFLNTNDNRIIVKTSDPTTGDDSDDGYGVSDIWVNTTDAQVWMLIDSTVGAAVWAELTGSGGAGTMSSFDIDADDTDPQTVSDGETVMIAGGDGVTTAASAPRTVTIDVDSTVVRLTGAQTLEDKVIDGDDNTVQDLPLTAIKTIGTNTKRFLTRDASGVPTDAINPPLDNLQHTHQNAANGGTLDAAAIASGILPEARGGTGTASGAANKALSNLASVAINTSLVSDTDVTDDLGSAAIRWDEVWVRTLYKDSDVFPVTVATGYTAVATELGYITRDTTYGTVYKNDPGANYPAVGELCVVVSLGSAGTGAAGSTIWVAQRGVVTLKLNANCAIGDYLITSSTAGQAAVLTAMRYEVFAIAESANAGGAGGTCRARLYTNTQEIPASSTNNAYQVLGTSTTAFVATINGAPTATSVVYNAPSSGNENAIVPNSATLLLKARLWNTTRGTYRLITAVNTATNTITTVSSADAWASGDTITIESQTTVTGVGFKMAELDFSQQTVVPTLARAIVTQLNIIDTTDPAAFVALHLYESYANSKNRFQYANSANGNNNIVVSVPIISGVVCTTVNTTGTGTTNYTNRLTGYHLAIP